MDQHDLVLWQVEDHDYHYIVLEEGENPKKELIDNSTPIGEITKKEYYILQKLGIVEKSKNFKEEEPAEKNETETKKQLWYCYDNIWPWRKNLYFLSLPLDKMPEAGWQLPIRIDLITKEEEEVLRKFLIIE